MVAPRAGAPALIDPRREDPLVHLQLDLRGTFLFRPVADEGSPSSARASYTCELLHLNDRAALPASRHASYVAYQSILESYVRAKAAGATARRRRQLKRAILNLPHPTVWAEMQRQEARIPELHALFAAAPRRCAGKTSGDRRSEHRRAGRFLRLIGPPGTGKCQIARSIAYRLWTRRLRAIEARHGEPF